MHGHGTARREVAPRFQLGEMLARREPRAQPRRDAVAVAHEPVAPAQRRAVADDLIAERQALAYLIGRGVHEGMKSHRAAVQTMALLWMSQRTRTGEIQGRGMDFFGKPWSAVDADAGAHSDGDDVSDDGWVDESHLEKVTYYRALGIIDLGADHERAERSEPDVKTVTKMGGGEPAEPSSLNPKTWEEQGQ